MRRAIYSVSSASRFGTAPSKDLDWCSLGANACPQSPGDFGGVKEVVLHNQSGIVVPTEEPTALHRSH